MLSIFQQYNNLILQTTLSFSLTLLLTFLNIPVLFLQGINTYIHPDNLAQKTNNGAGLRTAIRRPSSSEQPTNEPKRRHKSKEKFEFDENTAQIFRIKLDEGHLQTRLYFNDYRYSFIYSFLGFSSLLLYRLLGSDNTDKAGVLGNGSLIPIVLVFVGLSKSFSSLARASFEISASKRSEKQLSGVFGFLGFVFGLVVLSGAVRSVFDFQFGPINGGLGVFVATFMGCIAGFMYIPAGKIARSLWLGTDQIRCNLDIISCGWFARMILYANYLLNVLTALLWINPLSELLVYSNKESRAVGDQLVGKIGLSPENFSNFRICCLLLSGLTQLMALRPNLQIYLNEAVLSWYQRLHAGKVPDLDYSRAKVFLHNHYLCLAVLQFFTPPILLLLLLGLSYIDGNSLKGFVFPFAAFQELALCMAWWIVFVWSVFTSTNLMLYRLGVFYVS